MRTEQFGGIGPAVLLSAMLMAGPASAYDPNDPNNCIGAEWDDKRAVVVSRVIARPRVNFIKSPHDDDLKAATCPADTAACRQKPYLVAGDLVLTGQSRGPFTCVSYQSPQARQPIVTTVGADAGRADAVAESVGLDRHLVASIRQDHDFPGRGRQGEHRGRHAGSGRAGNA
jgi:hypothetical protein